MPHVRRKSPEVFSTMNHGDIHVTVGANGRRYKREGTVRIRTKKGIKKMGFGSTRTKIQKVGELEPGDHICYPASILRFIKHHAIVTSVINDETVEVIHYSGPPPPPPEPTVNSSSARPFSSSKKSQVMIRKGKVNLGTLVSKKKLYRVDYEEEDNCHPPDVVVKRAESRIDKLGLQSHGYNFFKNNCEHFASWCKTGEPFSAQSGIAQIRKPIE